MSRYLILAMSALLVFAVGCGDESTPLQADTIETVSTAPDESGIIVRGETGWGTTLVDLDTGLRSVVGIPIIDFCNGSNDFSILRFQSGFTPPGNVVDHVWGEAYAEVWPAGPFDCDIFTAGQPIATGTVKVVRFDNDFFVGGGRMNAYGWKATGALLGPGGEKYQFSEKITFLLPDGENDSIVKNIKVQLVGGH